MQHLEEGTIHAWLDDALNDVEAERVARHAAECEACSAMVAEARGLIAGASRIVSSLDIVRGGVIPPSGAQPRDQLAARRRSPWAMLRFSPTRAAIAATVLVAVGSMLAVREVGRGKVGTAARAMADQASPANEQKSLAAPTAPAPSPIVVPPKAASTGRDLAREQRDVPATRKSAQSNVAAAPPQSLEKQREPAAGATPERSPVESAKLRESRPAVPVVAAPTATPAPPSASGRVAGIATDAAAPVARSRALADTVRLRDSISSARRVRVDSITVTAQEAAVAQARAAFAMRIAFTADSASAAAGCYSVVGPLPAWATTIPQRFALDDVRISDSTSSTPGRRVVRTVNGTRMETPIPIASWRLADNRRVVVEWSTGAAGLTLTFALNRTPMTAAISDAEHSESVALTRTVCSPR